MKLQAQARRALPAVNGGMLVLHAALIRGSDHPWLPFSIVVLCSTALTVMLYLAEKKFDYWRRCFEEETARMNEIEKMIEEVKWDVR